MRGLLAEGAERFAEDMEAGTLPTRYVTCLTGSKRLSTWISERKRDALRAEGLPAADVSMESFFQERDIEVDQVS
ncbi:hypothetical protein GCM10028786_26230 [Flaviaesturariibacter terrae]